MRTPIEEVFRHLRESKKPDSWGLAYCVDFLFEAEQRLLEQEKDMLDQQYKEGWDNAAYEMEMWILKSKEKHPNSTK